MGNPNIFLAVLSVTLQAANTYAFDIFFFISEETKSLYLQTANEIGMNFDKIEKKDLVQKIGFNDVRALFFQFQENGMTVYLNKEQVRLYQEVMEPFGEAPAYSKITWRVQEDLAVTVNNVEITESKYSVIYIYEIGSDHYFRKFCLYVRLPSVNTFSKSRSTKQNSSENSDRCWRDCGSGRVDHCLVLICLFYRSRAWLSYFLWLRTN